MSESLGLRFLYHTVCGRAVLKLLVQPGISAAAGRFLDSGLSKPLIAPFLRSNRISLEGIDVPEGGFPSFNAAFARKRLETAYDDTSGHLISPCDGLFSCFPIEADSCFRIKHTAYSLRELLQDEALAETFSGGTAVILRLTPAHYHRYCYVDGGTVLRRQKISGVLHCVRPIATEAFPVYVQNSREYTVLASDSFGTMVQMEVGAMLVGRIVNHPGSQVRRGEEKGYFEYGGSTIVLLLTKDRAVLDEPFASLIDTGEERRVNLGERIGGAVCEA